jgi:hypothetical protein
MSGSPALPYKLCLWRKYIRVFRWFYSHITNYEQNKEGKGDRAVASGILEQIKSLGLSLTDGTA